jgi:hypothetical protein
MLVLWLQNCYFVISILLTEKLLISYVVWKECEISSMVQRLS